VLPPSYASFVEARRDGAFTSVSDLAGRVPELRKAELVALVQIGALNSIDETKHRRAALWHAEYVGCSVLLERRVRFASELVIMPK